MYKVAKTWRPVKKGAGARGERMVNPRLASGPVGKKPQAPLMIEYHPRPVSGKWQKLRNCRELIFEQRGGSCFYAAVSMAIHHTKMMGALEAGPIRKFLKTQFVSAKRGKDIVKEDESCMAVPRIVFTYYRMLLKDRYPPKRAYEMPLILKKLKGESLANTVLEGGSPWIFLMAMLLAGGVGVTECKHNVVYEPEKVNKNTRLAAIRTQQDTDGQWGTATEKYKRVEEHRIRMQQLMPADWRLSFILLKLTIEGEDIKHVTTLFPCGNGWQWCNSYGDGCKFITSDDDIKQIWKTEQKKRIVDLNHTMVFLARKSYLDALIPSNKYDFKDVWNLKTALLTLNLDLDRDPKVGPTIRSYVRRWIEDVSNDLTR